MVTRQSSLDNYPTDCNVDLSQIRMKKNSFILSSTRDLIKIKPPKSGDQSAKQQECENENSTDNGSTVKDGDVNNQNSIDSSACKIIVCDAPHDTRQILSTVIPVNVDSLMTMMYSKSKKILPFHEKRKQSNIILGDWTANDDGTKSRTIKYTQELKKHLGPKSSQVTELQVLRKCSARGKLYSIDTLTWNEGIPYADTFYIMTHHCLVSIEENQTMFTAYAQLKFKKPQWGIVRSILEKSCNDGMEEHYAELEKFLKQYFDEKIQMKTHTSHIDEKSSDNIDINNVEFDSLETDSLMNISIDPRKDIENTQHLDVNRIIKQDLGWKLILVVVLLVIAIITNIYLVVKIRKIEKNLIFNDRIDEIINSSGVNNRTEEDWLTILRHQERVHKMELVKWQELLEIATKMIKDTEGSLVELFHFMVVHEFNSTIKRC